MGYRENIFSFNHIEIKDLIISSFLIALVFIWPRGFPTLNTGFLAQFIATFFTVGLAFILHELAHRTVARKFGAWSEFRAWYEGLAIAIVLKIILGFTFIAPGAVYIHKDYLTTKENALISLAGPLTNVTLAILFLILPIPPIIFSGHYIDISGYGYYVNMFLAFFNMLPIYPFDGSKVISWNFLVWLLIFIPLFVLTFF
ncbi:peptidase M50 [Methanococcus vannielii SB]|jgi:Zn-dependent protease|uniref:Peptidase M50 n=1 Tax=Methanococcus vannielii (strain ATCC 35089 / DSM 1224 / JCM 13029 / OCM 148 / SB) TaxID=406327 RepID=A6UQG4_METVS|nr:site-2 protease family protein [Methanococcus vannielii]ABR54736.1 peptidase M50 [Methanococcus vannielii SB]